MRSGRPINDFERLAPIFRTWGAEFVASWVEPVFTTAARKVLATDGCPVTVGGHIWTGVV